jgi:hypothetical protein
LTTCLKKLKPPLGLNFLFLIPHRRIAPSGCFVRLNSHSPNDAVRNEITHCINAFNIQLFESVYDPYSVDEILDNEGNLLEIKNEVSSEYYLQQNTILNGVRKGINACKKLFFFTFLKL